MNYGSFRTLSVDEIGGEAADNARCRKLWELSERLLGGTPSKSGSRVEV